MTCIAFLPLSKLQNSIYRDLALPTLHFDLEPLFAKEYCASLGMSRQLPLRVVGDIGGGGAMARIERGRKVMGDRKGEWRQMDELPVRSEVSIRNADDYTIVFRLKFYCLLRTDIIRYLPVLFPRNSPQSRILQ
jgi:E3 ubiquitin-protein transferase RMND5